MTTTPFDDLRCVDCGHLWSEHSRIPDDPGLHFVMDTATAEEVRLHLVDLTAERDALKAETERLRSELAKTEPRFIVRLEPGVWIAGWNGDPGRTCVRESAKRFRTAAAAWSALKKARQLRPFTAAAVESVP